MYGFDAVLLQITSKSSLFGLYVSTVNSQNRLSHSYTQGEVTSQYLWSRYDRHFVGKTWHSLWNEGERYIALFRCKLNQFGLDKNVYMVIILPTKRIKAIS